MEQNPLADSNFQILGKPFKLRQPVPLCGRCQVIIDHWKPASGPDSVSFRHLDSRRDIELSAENGCGLCSLFLKRFWSTEEGEADGERTPSVFHEDRSRVNRPPIHKLMIPLQAVKGDIYIGGVKQTWRNPCSTHPVIIIPAASQGTRILLSKFPDDRTKAALLLPALDYDSPEPATTTMDALPLCKQWLETCRASHKSCRRLSPPTLPSPARRRRRHSGTAAAFARSRGWSKICDREPLLGLSRVSKPYDKGP